MCCRDRLRSPSKAAIQFYLKSGLFDTFPKIFSHKYNNNKQFIGKRVKAYKEFMRGDTEIPDKNDIEVIDEAFLKTTSKVVVANKVRTLSGQVKRAKTEAEKLDLIASQNAWLAGLLLVVFGQKN